MWSDMSRRDLVLSALSRRVEREAQFAARDGLVPTEDLVQDAVLALCMTDGARATSNLTSWSFGVMRRAMLKTHRQEQVRATPRFLEWPKTNT